MLWNYAVRHSAFIRNRCYNRRLGMTPYEKFTGKQPNFNKLEKFGNTCYAYIHEKTKLDKRAKEGKYVGQDPLSPAHLVYINGKVNRARNVKFINENMEIEEEINIPMIENSTELEAKNCESPDIRRGNCEEDSSAVSEGECVGETLNNKNINNGAIPKVPENLRYPTRTRRRPKHLNDYEMAADDDDLNVNTCIDYFCKISNIPLTYEQAISSESANEWQRAMQIEMDSLNSNDTFELTPRPGKKVIGGRWVYAVKLNERGEEIYKARYVAKGFSQIKDIDYEETFSPTARLTSIRVLLQLAANENLCVHQLDVKSAYLNASIDHELYIEQPKGFIKLDDHGNEFVFKLKRSIYGLKQFGRMWFMLLHNFLLDNDFSQCYSDNCMYVKFHGRDKIILIIYVDDIIVAASKGSDAEYIKDILAKRFKMKDFGTLNNFLELLISFFLLKGIGKLIFFYC